MDKVLPTGSYAWQQVANLFKKQSGEDTLQDPLDVKRHWTEKLCFKFKFKNQLPMEDPHMISFYMSEGSHEDYEEVQRMMTKMMSKMIKSNKKLRKNKKRWKKKQ